VWQDLHIFTFSSFRIGARLRETSLSTQLAFYCVVMRLILPQTIAFWI